MSSSFTHTHRKLLLSPNTTTTNNPTIQTCLYFCNTLKNDSAVSHSKLFCPTPCLNICPSTCQYSLLPRNNYPLQPIIPHHNLSPLLISMLILLASCFLIITFYTLYTKLYSHFYNFTLTNNPTPHTSHDEDPRGNMVFHPIWYIPTVGLNPTMVNSIKVYKYEKGSSETDCVVCLGEFLIGDELRILPKCNHSFHVHCIDTWLMSHVTCPLCRAPVDTGHDLGCGQTCQVSTTTITIRDGRIIMEDDHQPPTEEIVNNSTNNDDNDNNSENNKGRVKEENKGSSSERWTWERGTASLVTRSFSCSGKIFLSRYTNRPNSDS